MKTYIYIFRVIVWFIVLNLLGNTIFTEPNKYWIIYLIIDFIIACFMSYNKEIK